MRPIVLHQVAGTRSRFYLGKQKGSLELIENDHLEFHYAARDGSWIPLPVGQRIDLALLAPTEGLLCVRAERAGHNTALLRYRDAAGIADDLQVDFFAYRLCLNFPTGDGKTGEEPFDKAHWVWGQKQPGAILLVNCIEQRSDYLTNCTAHQERMNLLTPLRVEPVGIDSPPAEISLVLHATPRAAQRFSVYRKDAAGNLELVLGADSLQRPIAPISTSEPLNPQGEDLFVEALQFPGAEFEGLISLELHLVLSTNQTLLAAGELLKPIAGRLDAYETETVRVETVSAHDQILGVDTALMRAAPWIMTPNTLPAEKVYVSFITSPEISTQPFVEKLEAACREADVPLRELSQEECGETPFIQDLVSFGYSRKPDFTLPIACGSPVRGLLRNLELLDPDLGLIRMSGNPESTLDSFGNLEVSPPVTVGGKSYPLGRILFGGHGYGDFPGEREIMPMLRSFLYAQKVQSPFEIYTDWLEVGHADEILIFVPAETPKGFRLLLASPALAHAILQRVQEAGKGDTILFNRGSVINS